MHDVEPFYGWLELYSTDQDERSPFHHVEHNLFEFDRSIYNYAAHPLWEDFGSESLLLKILFADYEKGFAIIELIGEWNDLFENDFKLMAENCLTYLLDQGINRFVLICENVFNVYPEGDEYYEAMQDELEDGWMCLFRARPQVLDEFRNYGIDQWFYWNPELDTLPWRKLKPQQFFAMIEKVRDRFFLE